MRRSISSAAKHTSLIIALLFAIVTELLIIGERSSPLYVGIGSLLFLGSVFGFVYWSGRVVRRCVLTVAIFLLCAGAIRYAVLQKLRHMDVFGLDPIFYFGELFWITAAVLQGIHIGIIAFMRTKTRKRKPVCMRCGYSLRGLTLPRCPECGTPFDPHLLGMV
jgi:hypothetical protein